MPWSAGATLQRDVADMLASAFADDLMAAIWPSMLLILPSHVDVELRWADSRGPDQTRAQSLPVV